MVKKQVFVQHLKLDSCVVAKSEVSPVKPAHSAVITPTSSVVGWSNVFGIYVGKSRIQ